MSDVSWTALITAAMTVLTALITAIMTVIIAYMNNRLRVALQDAADKAAIAAAKVVDTVKQTADDAAAATALVADKAEAVRTTLEDTTAVTEAKLDGLAEVAKKTHVLVNSNMAVQLDLNAKMARRIADMTREPIDIKAADLAERYSREHEAKQAVVDKQTTPVPVRSDETP